MTKKRVFVIALAVCMLAILSVGSLAWFNDSDSVQNDFFVGDSQNPTGTDFSVTVSETTGSDYYNALPGSQIAKDPLITNTGDFTQWIRVKVTLNKAQGWIAGGGTLRWTELFFGSSYGAANDPNATENWLLVDNTAVVDGDNAAWYLYLNSELAPEASAGLFTSVKIPTNFTQEEMDFFNDEFSIVVVAEALQRDHTGDSAVEAFRNVGWLPGSEYQDT